MLPPGCRAGDRALHRRTPFLRVRSAEAIFRRRDLHQVRHTWPAAVRLGLRPGSRYAERLVRDLRRRRAGSVRQGLQAGVGNEGRSLSRLWRCQPDSVLQRLQRATRRPARAVRGVRWLRPGAVRQRLQRGATVDQQRVHAVRRTEPAAVHQRLQLSVPCFRRSVQTVRAPGPGAVRRGLRRRARHHQQPVFDPSTSEPPACAQASEACVADFVAGKHCCQAPATPNPLLCVYGSCKTCIPRGQQCSKNQTCCTYGDVCRLDVETQKETCGLGG